MYTITSEFLEDLPDREVYIKVKRSKIHYAAAHPPIFPCAEVIEWIIQRIKPEDWNILDSTNKVIATLRGEDANIYYRLPPREETLNERWYLNHPVNPPDMIREWYIEPDEFRAKKYQEYQTISLRPAYRLVAAMFCRLYGRPDATRFSGAWVALMNEVVTRGTRFNWENVIMSSIKSNVNAALALDAGTPSEFYMASYLMDAVCARCHIEGWAHNWVAKEHDPIHKHLMVFWDT